MTVGDSPAVRACLNALLLPSMLWGSPLGAQSEGRFRQEIIHIPGPLKGLRLGLHHVVRTVASTGEPARIVLILHGSGVPSSGNPGYPFGGRSMMEALAEEGLDVWALDFHGMGESDRYPEMSAAPDRHPPLGTAEQHADQVDSAVAFLTRRYGVRRVDLIGDSGGTLAAGVFATRRPERISRLVLFGPVTPFTGGPSPGETLPAYTFVTPRELWTLFATWSDAAGQPAVLDSTTYEAWAARYLESDPTSGTRTPASVKVPGGWQADLAAISRGRFTYDPAEIRAPTLIVMGEWDAIATFAGAEWLLKALRQAPQRRLSVIGRGSHTIQYETGRTQLYRVMADFLNERE